jgi:hypothetical protein
MLQLLKSFDRRVRAELGYGNANYVLSILNVYIRLTKLNLNHKNARVIANYGGEEERNKLMLEFYPTKQLKQMEIRKIR